MVYYMYIMYTLQPREFDEFWNDILKKEYTLRPSNGIISLSGSEIYIPHVTCTCTPPPRSRIPIPIT